MRTLTICTFILVVITLGCIEGPTVEQDATVTIPDGKTLLIIRHYSFLDRTAEQLGLTVEEYESSLLSTYGESRTIQLVRENGSFTQPTIIADFEIETIADNYSGLECVEINGAKIRLPVGEYSIYDNEVSGNRLRSFFIDSNDYLQDCLVERVSHLF